MNPFGFKIDETFGLGSAAMASMKRIKTKYPGVLYIEGISSSGKPERIYYIRYRKDGKQVEEKAGRQFQDDMTPARANALRADRIQGRDLSNDERRQEALQEKWTLNRLWEEYKVRNPGLKGMVTDQNRYQNHIRPVLGLKEPAELSTFDVDRLRLRLLKEHRPGTVKNVLELLRRIINFGVKKHLCHGVPFVIEMPRVNNIKTEDLTPDELSRLWQAIEEETNLDAANFMRMVLFTGMRRGELFKLQWEDVDFERGFIHILDPKGGPDQVIPLNPSARELLEAQPKTESPYVFPGRNGGKRVDIKKSVNRIKERAGLPKEFRALHGLRHVYASMLASSGQVDLYTLQKLLTHKSPTMTQRYAHLRDEALRKASDLAGNLIKQVQESSGQQVAPMTERTA
jgi:integrase